MTPIHLIPRIISRLHSRWFSVSVWAAGIEVMGSALLQHSFNSFSPHTLSTRASLNPVTGELSLAVGKRRDSSELHVWQWHSRGPDIFGKIQTTLLAFCYCSSESEKPFLRAISQAPVNMLWYWKFIHREVSCEPKWNSECYFLQQPVGLPPPDGYILHSLWMCASLPHILPLQ